MLRILLDQNVPFGVRDALKHHGYDAQTAHEMGWSRYPDGNLISAAENDGFDVLVSCDQNRQFQQNLSVRRIAFVVLRTNRWRVIEDFMLPLLVAVATATPGTYREVGPDRQRSR